MVIVDGEHSPSVVESAIRTLESEGAEVLALVWGGGTEKADPSRYPLPTPLLRAESPAAGLARAIAEYGPDEVVDLSDDPVVTKDSREELVAVAASRGATYVGPGYSFEAPTRPRVSTLPTIAIVGTGKRTGKTAVCAEFARLLASADSPPLIVTMGRGGPREPVYIPARGVPADPISLVEMANDGLHAASDYIEDALFTGLPSIGAWRCGGGFLGETGPNVVADAVRLAIEKAKETGSRVLLLEGSGASIPPVHADVTVTVVPWSALETASEEPPPVFQGLGLYRLLIAEALVVTGCPQEVDPELEVACARRLSELARARKIPAREGISATPDVSGDPKASKTRSCEGDLEVVLTSFELTPTAPIRGRKVALATTAPPGKAAELASQLESRHGAEVVGVSVNLSRPDALAKDLSRLLPYVDVLLTELKARAVDVAARQAIASEVEVIFVENRPRPIGDGDRLAVLAQDLLELAYDRFEAGE